MKPTSILIGLIAIVGLSVAGILLSTPTTPAGGDGTGLSAAGDGSGSKLALTKSRVETLSTPEPEPTEVADRTVIVDEATLLAEQAEEREVQRLEEMAKGPFMLGRVVDSRGFPVPNAQINFSGDGRSGNLLALGMPVFASEAETDINGGYKASRRGLRGEEVTAKVQARGFQVYRDDLRSERRGEDYSMPAITMQRGVVLGGVVRDALGNPVEGALVRRTDPGEEGMYDGMMGMAAMFRGRGAPSDTTDENGRFELGNEPPGKYVVVALHDAFEKARIEGQATQIGMEDLTLQLEFPPSASIAGVIKGFPQGKRFVKVKAIPVQEADSEEITGISIMMQSFTGSGYSAEVEEDGTFLIQGMPADREFDITASVSEGFMQDLTCSNEVRAKAGTQGLELQYDSGAGLSFRLIDGETNQPVLGSTVRYRWTEGQQSNFAMGAKKREFAGSRVEIDELRPKGDAGVLALTITSSGYRDQTETDIKIVADEQTDLGLISLQKAPILRVRVVEAGSGKPLSRARVGLTPTESGQVEGANMINLDSRVMNALSTEGGTERTDKDGWVEVSAVSTPTGTLTIRRSGFALLVVNDVAMPTSGWREEIVTLSKGGELEVIVLDSLGNPVSQASVKYKSEGGADGDGTTSKKGRIKFRDVAAGDYSVKAARPGDNGAFWGDSAEAKATWTPLKVVSGVDQEITLRVPLDTVLAGVVLVDGQPLAGVLVNYLSNPDSSGSSGGNRQFRGNRGFGGNDTSDTTDANGAFLLKGLKPGDRALSIRPSESVPSQKVLVALNEGQNESSFTLKIGILEGTVVDANGSPIQGAIVKAYNADSSDLEGDRFMRAMFGDSGGVRTGLDGRYSLIGVPTDVSLVVKGSSKGHTDSLSAPVTVAAGKKKTDIGIQLGMGASIRVSLTGDAAPFQMIRAELVQAEEGEDEQTVRKFVQGSEALLSDLVPGKWKVSLSTNNGQRESMEIEVSAGEEGQVTLAR
ncbi:MAG: protocatechuate 3,4-dioxygenase beta subunit [Planctomycetota bacterium]|jgi:protocatechuate 3,4-dioxygenase beta subunit